MNLYVDDRRSPPEGWALARSVTAAIRLIASFVPDEVSLDHDICHSIGETKIACNETFAGVAVFIASIPHEMRPKKVIIHTSNPVGAQTMLAILKGKVESVKIVPAEKEAK